MSDSNRARAMQSSARNLSALLMLALGIAAMPGFAQETDTVAPIIELEELEDGVADRSQVFTVLIAEDVGLQDATLFYRREGQLPFTAAAMQPLGNTGFYSVSIPTDNSDLRTIEYYLQARDLAGNRTVSGFAFDPYRRTLQPSVTSLRQPGSLDGAQIRFDHTFTSRHAGTSRPPDPQYRPPSATSLGADNPRCSRRGRSRISGQGRWPRFTSSASDVQPAIRIPA